MSTAEQKLTKILAILNEDRTPAVNEETVPWYDPTEAQKDAFCAKTGFQRQYADGWTPDVPNEPGTWQAKIQPLVARVGTDLTDEAIEEYHGMGFTIDGARPSWTKEMLDTARLKCSQLEDATTQEEQDVIAGEGASNLPTPTVRILLMGQGAGQPAYYGPLRQDPSINNAAKFCVGTLDPSTGGVP